MAAEEKSWEFLHSLWSSESLDSAFCKECSAPIDASKAFARTSRLVDHNAPSTSTCAQGIDVSDGSKIHVFHRHLQCLYETTAFVAVSHVWDPKVAELQVKRHESTSSVREVDEVVRELPARVCAALEDGFPEQQDLEVWHDYISVPQWTAETKADIMLRIPELFKQAKMTVVCLTDVKMSAFEAMRSGPSAAERARGMGAICSAKWFGRMWTIMEFIRTKNMAILTEEYKLVGPDPQQPGRCIVEELQSRWRDEVREIGFGRHLEQVVRIDGYFLPWQLGDVVSVRGNALHSQQQSCFGLVHAILSRRRVTRPEDFFYAFENILMTGVELGTAVLSEPRAVLLRMAMTRLLSNDLSPLFMIPTYTQTGWHLQLGMGYVDHYTWGLGDEVREPTCGIVRPGKSLHRIVLSAEEIGGFRFARRYRWGQTGPKNSLAAICRMTLDVVGTDVDAFVTTVAVRLYGQERDAVFQKLAEDGRRRKLQMELEQLYDSFVGTDDVETVEKIGELIGLSDTSLGEAHEDPQTPMTFLQHHGGTLHHGPAGAIVGVSCAQCRGIFLLRILLLRPPSALTGAKAYRISGLKYRFSHAGGMGMLVLNGKMVGRFVWGTPTCECDKLAQIEVAVDDLPLPGRSKKAQAADVLPSRR